jgi:hypothetical protein
MTTDDVLSRFAPFPLRAQLFNGAGISADSCGTWTAEVREENLAAYAAEILVGPNLVVGNRTIYCTLVVQDVVIVGCAEPWFTSRGETGLRIAPQGA